MEGIFDTKKDDDNDDDNITKTEWKAQALYKRFDLKVILMVIHKELHLRI